MNEVFDFIVKHYMIYFLCPFLGYAGWKLTELHFKAYDEQQEVVRELLERFKNEPLYDE